jgi:general secretion pathway protein E
MMKRKHEATSSAVADARAETPESRRQGWLSRLIGRLPAGRAVRIRSAGELEIGPGELCVPGVTVPLEEIRELEPVSAARGAGLRIVRSSAPPLVLRFSRLEEALQARRRIEVARHEARCEELIRAPLGPAELREIVARAGASPDPFDARLLADMLLAQGRHHAASDLHIERAPEGGRVRLRRHGRFIELGSLSPAQTARLINRLKVLAGLPTYVQGRPAEGHIHRPLGGHPVQARLTVFPTVHGDRATLRYFQNDVRRLELQELGFDREVLAGLQRGLAAESGLLLVTGPANSGKTTTIYAALRHLLRTRENSAGIYTIEDPVECWIEGISQTELDPARGLTYEQALSNLLRQDPEVLLIGEIRDRATAAAAIQAGLTGHLVLSTLHCHDAPEAVVRLLDMGIEPYRLSSVLRGVLAQRLVPVPCGCAGDPGCARCLGSGVAGRRAVGEWLSVSEPLRRMILEKPMIDALAGHAAREGMTPLAAKLAIQRAAKEAPHAARTTP